MAALPSVPLPRVRAWARRTGLSACTTDAGLVLGLTPPVTVVDHEGRHLVVRALLSALLDPVRRSEVAALLSASSDGVAARTSLQDDPRAPLAEGPGKVPAEPPAAPVPVPGPESGPESGCGAAPALTPVKVAVDVVGLTAAGMTDEQLAAFLDVATGEVTQVTTALLERVPELRLIEEGR